MSDFYQAYLNAFSPRVYYNTNTTGNPATAVLSIPSSRAVVSGLHAVALGILLILVAILLSTLIKVPQPSEGSLRLFGGIIWIHAISCGDALHRALKARKLDPDTVQMEEIWKDTRFSIDSKSGRIIVHSPEEEKTTCDGTPKS
jgi:hypothetical protein